MAGWWVKDTTASSAIQRVGRLLAGWLLAGWLVAGWLAATGAAKHQGQMCWHFLIFVWHFKLINGLNRLIDNMIR